ncbi:hypothetical protein [Sphaerotilus microaerophilus]|uniref:hypothetical protein n=1 Tax=Sphaerotilus microaerophilus TaxID=2914710 RepID=UPI002072B3D9|nr:hypothetical protein [Sphaerotilus sp. FB-5]
MEPLDRLDGWCGKNMTDGTLAWADDLQETLRVGDQHYRAFVCEVDVDVVRAGIDVPQGPDADDVLARSRAHGAARSGRRDPGHWLHAGLRLERDPALRCSGDATVTRGATSVPVCTSSDCIGTTKPSHRSSTVSARLMHLGDEVRINRDDRSNGERPTTPLGSPTLRLEGPQRVDIRRSAAPHGRPHPV